MNEYQACAMLEATIAVGQKVEARWTNSFNYHRFAAEVVKINAKSVRIRLLEAKNGYPIGQEFPVPRVHAQGWSVNNGVFPPKEVA